MLDKLVAYSMVKNGLNYMMVNNCMKYEGKNEGNMRILIVHNEYKIRGGEDAVVKKQYQNLKSKGIEVHKYIVSNKKIDNMSKSEKIKLFLKGFFLMNYDNKLLKTIESYKPDVVHIHNVFPLINPSIYESLNKRGIKIVQTLHNYRLLCPNGLFFRNGHICEDCLLSENKYKCAMNSCYRNSKIESFWYSRMISLADKKGSFKKIDRFVALNEFMKDKFIQNGYPSNSLSIIPNGIFDNVKDFVKIKKEYYLYIGRLSEEKGLRTLLDVFEKGSRQLIIIGTGPLEEHVKDITKMNANIEYLGFKSGEEKDVLIAQAKAIIVPSEWYENLPTVIIEAFMNSTPAIVSNLGGAQHMVEEGYNGTKFDAGDGNKLLEALNRLESLEADILNRNARSTFLGTYESSIVTDKLVELYE
jgi:glycosyltransferase involved in cell wall biosynthesis